MPTQAVTELRLRFSDTYLLVLGYRDTSTLGELAELCITMFPFHTISCFCLTERQLLSESSFLFQLS